MEVEAMPALSICLPTTGLSVVNTGVALATIYRRLRIFHIHA